MSLIKKLAIGIVAGALTYGGIRSCNKVNHATETLDSIDNNVGDVQKSLYKIDRKVAVNAREFAIDNPEIIRETLTGVVSNNPYFVLGNIPPKDISRFVQDNVSVLDEDAMKKIASHYVLMKYEKAADKVVESVKKSRGCLTRYLLGSPTQDCENAKQGG